MTKNNNAFYNFFVLGSSNFLLVNYRNKSLNVFFNQVQLWELSNPLLRKHLGMLMRILTTHARYDYVLKYFLSRMKDVGRKLWSWIQNTFMKTPIYLNLHPKIQLVFGLMTSLDNGFLPYSQFGYRTFFAFIHDNKLFNRCYFNLSVKID